MACQQLFPGPPCGSQGSCLNGTICICEEGYSKSKEFSYFISDEVVQQRGLCNHNENIIKGLCLCIIVSVALVLPLHLYMGARSRKTLFKLLPTLLGEFTALIFSSYRVAAPQDALFGYDVLFTLCYSLSMICEWYGFSVWFIKFLKYLNQTFPFATDARWVSSFLIKIRPVINFLDFAMFQLFWISCFVEGNFESMVLVRLSLAYIVLRYVYALIVEGYMLNLFIRDMAKFLALTKDESAQGIRSEEKRQLVYKIKRSIPQLRALRNLTMVYAPIALLCFGIPLCSDLALQNGLYFMLIPYVLYHVMVVFSQSAIYIANRKSDSRYQKQKSKQLIDSVPSLEKVSNSDPHSSKI